MRPLICLYVWVAASVWGQVPSYSIVDLGSLSGNASSGVTAINNSGQVVGYSSFSGQRHAFRTAPNQPIHWSTDDLGSLGGGDTIARGVNSLGQAVGQSLNSTGATRGFRTEPNAAITVGSDVGSLAGGDTRAYAINDAGQVTGDSTLAPGFFQAFRTAPNRAIDPATDKLTIGPFACSSPPNCPPWHSSGTSINSSGDVGGSIQPPNGLYEVAFVYQNGVGTQLPFVHAPGQYYTGINDKREIAANPNFTDLSVWRDGVLSTFIAGCICAPIGPNGINNSLQVLTWDGNGRNNFMLISDGVVYPLPSLLPANSGWTNLRGIAINDRSQIAGTGTFNGEFHAFRMDPVSSPEQLLTQLLAQIDGMHFSKGRTTSLEASVKAALASVRAGETGDARRELYAFENKLRARRGKDVSEQQADQLFSAAEAVIRLL